MIFKSMAIRYNGIMSLVDSLVKDGWLKTPKIIESFKAVKRADFMPARIGYPPTSSKLRRVAGGPEDMKDMAELNEALPIGYGQTISQPLTVAFILELLAPKEGDRILDVGSGSGWTSALLGQIVGPKGRVIAVETIPELKEFGENNAKKYNKWGQIQFILGDGSKGYESESPYDKILCSAAAQKQVPLSWKQQLEIGGRIVTPVGSSVWLLIKKSAVEFEEIEYPGFAFVPLIENKK